MAGILVRCPHRDTYSAPACLEVARHLHSVPGWFSWHSPALARRLGQPVIVYSHLVGHMGIEQLILIQINPWILEGCPGLDSLPGGCSGPASSSSLFSKRGNSQLALLGLSTVGEDGCAIKPSPSAAWLRFLKKI